jgi:hypothetical protein
MKALDPAEDLPEDHQEAHPEDHPKDHPEAHSEDHLEALPEALPEDTMDSNEEYVQGAYPSILQGYVNFLVPRWQWIEQAGQVKR